MKFQKKDIFTIPNILTYIRLLCVPFFAWLVLDGSIANHVWWALGVFIFASITDVVDGIIARKCNMMSDIGKVLDPLADKMLQITAVITLTLIGYIPIIFPIIFVVKEAYMIIGAGVLLLFARRKVTIQSNIWGKLATVILAMAVFTSFFHEVFVANKVYLDVFLFSVSAVLTIIAAIQYTVIMIREIKASDAKAEEEKFGEELEDGGIDTSTANLHGGLVIDVDEDEIEKPSDAE